MAPEAMAPPSLLTASPIQAPATSGSSAKKVLATHGRTRSSTATNTIITEERIVGTIALARIALPVAMAAATPQMEMPEAIGAAHSGVNLNTLRDRMYTTGQ